VRSPAVDVKVMVAPRTTTLLALLATAVMVALVLPSEAIVAVLVLTEMLLTLPLVQRAEVLPSQVMSDAAAAAGG
jgi:hypothetical protein